MKDREQTPPEHGADLLATQGPSSPISAHGDSTSAADAFATGGGHLPGIEGLLSPGQRLEGRYEIRRLLGQGGMSQVYLVRDNQTNTPLALKRLHPHLVEQEALKRRFFEEIRIATQIHHPHILNVLRAGHDKALDIVFFVMEYIPGQTLATLLTEKKGTPFSLEESLRLLAPIAEALDDLHHRGIIHRDIKPSNLYITEEGHTKLMDFGIARHLQASGRAFTMTQAGLGTAYYMAPEQLQGGSIDKRCDIFSLSVVFYEMLTGQLPVGIPKPPSRLNPDLSPNLDAALFQAMDPAPQDRPQSATALITMLRQSMASAATGSQQQPQDASGSALRSASRQVGEALKDLGRSWQTLPPQQKQRLFDTLLGGLRQIIIVGILIGVPLGIYLIYQQEMGKRSSTKRFRSKRGFFQRPRRRTIQTTPDVDTTPFTKKTSHRLEIRRSSYKRYPSGQAFYTLQGILIQGGKDQPVIGEMALYVELFDAKGDPFLRKKVTANKSYQAALYPGGRQAFYALFQVRQAPQRVRISLHSQKRPRRTQRHQKGPIHRVTLKFNTPLPKDLALTLDEQPLLRGGRSKPSSLFFRKRPGTYHDFAWKITNTGRESIHKLKLSIRYFTKEDRQIHELDFKGRPKRKTSFLYAITSSLPPLLPGETRMLGEMAFLPLSFDHYQLTVEDIE